MSLDGLAASRVSTPLVERVQARAFALRNLLAGLPLVAALLVATPPDATRLVPALALGTLAAALRAWCVAFNRYAQGEHKTLATGGPYAWLRNPLYVGNMLAVLGAVLSAGPLWLAPLCTAWAFLVYDQVVRHEELRLRHKYGEAYASYCRTVPRWLPRIPAERSAPPRPFWPALLAQSRTLLLLAPFAAKLYLLAA